MRTRFRAITALAIFGLVWSAFTPVAAIAQNEDENDLPPVTIEQPSTLAPPGMVVPLLFAERVQSQNAARGEVVELRAWSDVEADGKVVIAQDAKAQGRIVSIRKPRSFGRKAEIRVRLDWVEDVNGGQVPLENYRTGRRFDPKGPGAAAGGLLILGPVGLVGGLFVQGGHITIKQGTRIQAQVLLPNGESANEKTPPVEGDAARPGQQQ